MIVWILYFFCLWTMSSYCIILYCSMRHFSLLVHVFCFCMLVFAELYVFELAISFVPYWIIGHFVLLLLLVLYWRKDVRAKYRWKSYLLFVLGHIFWIRYFVSLVWSFYTWVGTSSGSGDITVFFANIKKNNYQYDALLDMVASNNPDVLMFVEYADHHDQNIMPLLHDTYPYSNRFSWSKKHIGTIVFSKYPINNLADDFPQGARRYGYFAVQKNLKTYYMYLVHTSSPVSYFNFVVRNRQFDQIIHDMDIHDNQRSEDDTVLMIGDFNVSPWSRYYDTFVGRMPHGFQNITRTFPLLFTWRIYFLPFVWAHIDHIFVKHGILYNLRSVYIPWSDHRWYLFDLD